MHCRRRTNIHLVFYWHTRLRLWNRDYRGGNLRSFCASGASGSSGLASCRSMVGRVLLILGGFYIYRFSPKKEKVMDTHPKRQMTLGLVVGNRGFFPDHLARSGRQEMIATLEAGGVKVIALAETDSKHGAVESRHARRRSALTFSKNTGKPSTESS